MCQRASPGAGPTGATVGGARGTEAEARRGEDQDRAEPGGDALMLLSDRALARLGFAAMTFLWGLGLVVVRLGLREGVPPFGGAAVRFALAAAVSAVATRGLRIGRKGADWERYLAVTALSIVLPFGLVYLALQRVVSGTAGVTAATMPLAAAVLARIVLGERLSWRQVAGIVTGVAGIALVYRQSLLGDGPDPLGVALLLGAALANGAAAVYLRARCAGYPPGELNTVSMALGALLLGALATALEGPWPPLTPLGAFTIVWLAVFSSAVCYAIYYWLLARREVAKVTLCSLLFPLVTFALEPFLLGESLGRGAWLGAGVVLLGVTVALWDRLRPGAADSGPSSSTA